MVDEMPLPKRRQRVKCDRKKGAGGADAVACAGNPQIDKAYMKTE